MNSRRSAARFGDWGHELIEEGVTLRVLAARANKMIVEIDVIADDALDRTVGHAVEHGIQAVSSS